ncbi:cytochrome c oxidase subunit 3 family protein [Denitrobaculum tricleocarpae]|uniref:Cytochrome c oxidase subunit 3 family protein n=1 Tax=Denitrobaculum tricleocarpae TaxID=2591009 RepID=A0A545TMT2_9PROT|nr:cytochrome c oxidase subunit 3 family protein [Denitrobaculum tricleocarpae]TQV78539.1 cytochrome c oxidase subunit 3 family protein [Denitrobaculum tricleocarpae]
MSEAKEQGLLAELPGDLMMWVLIISELLVFGAGLAAFLAVRISDPAGFADAQDHLDRAAGGLNTAVLVTSGLCAALANRDGAQGQRKQARLWLAGAAALGLVFLWVKAIEYGDKLSAGIGTETHPFFTFYYLLTGFHAAHVVAGIVILGFIACYDSPRNLETGTAFWHMVDLIWVLLFPVIYLLR